MQYFNQRNRAILREMVVTDFKLRYQGSVLGYAWSLLRPLFMFLILYVVFVKFLKVGGNIPHYPIYLLLGIVLWNFFSEMTSQSLSSIVTRGDLIRKIRIPRWMIVATSSISALINLGLNLVVVAGFMIINKVDVSQSALLIPLVLAEIYIFALGLSLLMAALYVKYRDISYIWEVLLQAGFYLTPILYSVSLITNVTFQKILLLNPMAQAIQDIRSLMVTPDTITIADIFGNGVIRLGVLAGVVLVFIGGALYFRRESKYFAENL